MKKKPTFLKKKVSNKKKLVTKKRLQAKKKFLFCMQRQKKPNKNVYL